MNKSELRDALVKWKFRISYFSGFLTTFAAIVIISNTLQDKIHFIGINLQYWWVLLIVCCLVIAGAYTFDKLGFIESEVTYANSKNKLLIEIKGRN